MIYGSSKSFSSASESRGSGSVSSSGDSASMDSSASSGGGGGGGEISSSSSDSSSSSSDSCSSCSGGVCSFTVQAILIDEFNAEIIFTNTGTQVLMIFDLSHPAGGSIFPASAVINPGDTASFSVTSAGDLRLTEVYYYNECYFGQSSVIIPET